MFLVTRPQPKASETANALVAQGFEALVLPAVSIELLSAKGPTLNAGYDVIVVTSSYARTYLEHYVSTLTHAHSHFVCVGSSTAQMVEHCLKKQALKASIEIASPQNSEGVIASHVFLDIANKTVAILKGRGGRRVIADYLIQNKAKTDIYEVYQRTGAFRVSGMNQVDGKSIRCIIVTSVDIAEQIFEYFSLDWLKGRIFIVASQRIYDYVMTKGAQHIMLSGSASTESIVLCANQLHLSGVLSDKR